MIVEGLVTDIHEELFTFVLNKTTTVCLVLLFLKNPNQKFPEKGSRVKVEFPFSAVDNSKENTLILYSGCNIEGNLSVNCSFNNFAKTIKKLDLQPMDLLQVYKNYKYLKKHFKSPYQSNEILIICIIETMSKNMRSQDGACTILPDFDLKFVSEISYVDLTSEVCKDLNYWTFGNHWSYSKRPNQIEYLFGYLYVHKKYGSIYFTDFKRKVPCIATNSLKDNLIRFMSNYVLIRDYVVLTEVYNGQKPPFLEYLLIDLSKVTVVHVLDNIHQPIIQKNVTDDCKRYQKTTSFKIVSKSVPVVVNTRNYVECWLEVLVEERQMFVCLPSSYSEIFPLLQENSEYQLYYNKSLKNAFGNKELHTLNPLPQYELQDNCIFVSLNSVVASQNMFDEIRAFHELSVSSDLITFEGKLKEKKFVDPLSSRTKKITFNQNFGTPGYKTHLLEFDADGSPLTVYLNNWENKLIPLGLIPNMVLRVRNVIAQKGRYFKSTILTSFEVVRYEPECQFETANLCGGIKNIYWGLPFFLGAGEFLPVGVIIWASITFLEIENLKIYYQCIKCSCQVKYNNPCLKCNENDQELTAEITLITCDHIGESKVIAKDKYGMLLLKLLLGTQDKIFKKWCYGFAALNNFEYSGERCNSNEVENKIPSKKKVSVRETLTRHFDIINEHGLNLDLKCRKVSDEGDEGYTVYFLLDARRS